jgi:hypothetical protein
MSTGGDQGSTQNITLGVLAAFLAFLCVVLASIKLARMRRTQLPDDEEEEVYSEGVSGTLWDISSSIGRDLVSDPGG